MVLHCLGGTASIGSFVIGRILSHCRILEKLGSGGMGDVYLAEDVRLGRKLALKVLAPKLVTDQDRVRRFGQEARAASARCRELSECSDGSLLERACEERAAALGYAGVEPVMEFLRTDSECRPCSSEPDSSPFDGVSHSSL